MKRPPGSDQLEQFRRLISRFCAGQLTASEFERAYLRGFKACNVQVPEAVFEILNELFLDVDAYCGDPAGASLARVSSHPAGPTTE